MRQINRVVVHSTFTPKDIPTGFDELNQQAKEAGTKPQSGIHCPWHYIIRRDGTLEKGREEYDVGCHARRYDADSLGVILEGGRDSKGNIRADFSDSQIYRLLKLLEELENEYYDLTVDGFKDIPNGHPQSPPFDIKKLWQSRNCHAREQNRNNYS